MTASTAPTQPPDKCPACGETKVRYNTGKIIQFMCNCIMGVDGSDPCECSRAFSAAIALRAERDAARARLAELRAVCDAARKYSDAHHFELINGNKLLYCVDKQDDYEFDAALAALASGAVVEGEVTK